MDEIIKGIRSQSQDEPELALRSRAKHCLTLCFVHYNGAEESIRMTFRKNDPEENKGVPFDYVRFKKTAGKKENVLT